MKTGTTTKLKFRLLQRELKLPKYAAAGLLQCLWDGVSVNAPDGALGRFSNEEIAFDLDYEGDPDALIAALLKCRWIDEDPKHRLLIHDWYEHCEDYVHLRLARARSLFADGSMPRLTRLPKDERAEIERDFKAKFTP